MVFSYPVCSAKITMLTKKKKIFFFKKETGARSGLVTSFFNKGEIKKLFKKFKIEIIIHEINFDIISKKNLVCGS